MNESVKFDVLYCRSNRYSPVYHSRDGVTNILFSSGTTGENYFLKYFLRTKPARLRRHIYDKNNEFLEWNTLNQFFYKEYYNTTLGIDPVHIGVGWAKLMLAH